MKHFIKLTPFTQSLLLLVGLSLQTMNAHADRVNASVKMTKYNIHSGKDIVIKKPSNASRQRSRTAAVTSRTRHYRGIRIVRSHGHPYVGYGFFYSDNDAYKWLAFTAITIMMLDNISEDQQRLHEQAQIRATTAEVGETIIWKDADASGSVKTTRIGKSTYGRHCREFQQTVTIGGKTEQVYGTACQQQDGAWEIVR